MNKTLCCLSGVFVSGTLVSSALIATSLVKLNDSSLSDQETHIWDGIVYGAFGAFIVTTSSAAAVICEGLRRRFCNRTATMSDLEALRNNSRPKRIAVVNTINDEPLETKQASKVRFKIDGETPHDQ